MVAHGRNFRRERAHETHDRLQGEQEASKKERKPIENFSMKRLEGACICITTNFRRIWAHHHIS
jgi:hypothetical protein